VIQRAPETIQLLYAELFDQLRAAETEFVPAGGSFVSRSQRSGT